MTIDEMIEVLQAYKSGEKIQVRNKNCTDSRWILMLEPVWNFPEVEYRVKPKPMEIYVNVYGTDYGVAFGGARSTIESSKESGAGKFRTVKFIEVIE